jgi:ketosteroid isomerase-like protein
MATPGYALSWQVNKVEASHGGDLAYSMGTYEGTMNDAKGKPVTDRGKYVTVWEKQPDGKWNVVADIYNSDLPAPEAAKH